MAVFEVRPAGDISPVFDAMLKDGAEALYVVGDTFMNSNRVRISSLAIQARLPTVYVAREYVEAGGFARKSSLTLIVRLTMYFSPIAVWSRW